jgi:hypothetical protein
MAWYMELTENWPFEFSDYQNISDWSLNCMSTILGSRLCQDRKLASTKLLLNEILVTLLFLTMLYKLGYCSFKVFSSSHLSSQNLIYAPFYNLKFLKFRNWSLAFSRPVQNCESPDFLFTWVIDLSLRNLFLSNCCQAPILIY